MNLEQLVKEIRTAVNEKLNRDVPLSEINIRYIDVGDVIDAEYLDIGVGNSDGEIIVEVS